MSSRSALIVGAGIGGLAAAVALLRHGWRVRVFERAPNPRELGFALALAPNALASLRELGIADTVTARGAVPARAEIRRPDGTVLRTIDLGNLATPNGPRAVVTLRPALHGALLDAVGGNVLELGKEAVGFTAAADAVTLEFSDRSRASGDLLVGADGIGSMIRRVLHPTEPAPRPSGYVAVRGVAHDAVRHLGTLDGLSYLGDGVEAGLSRASATAIYWYLSLLAVDVGTNRDPRSVLARHGAGFDDQFKAITSASDDMRVDELYERPPLAAWGQGPVTLLGDAAHPMLPHAGQGAAQALEDAVGLALALGGGGSIEAALRRYEAVRVQRTRGIMALGRRIARVTTTHSRMVQTLRDTAVRLMPHRLVVGALVQADQKDPNRALRPA